MVEVLCHSSIKITENKVIYVDPFKIDEENHDADYIFCTHSHYDHLSIKDINKIKKDDTILIVTKDAEEIAKTIAFEENIVVVEPDKQYELKDLSFRTTYSYNINKNFHPKEKGWVGYIIKIQDKTYYIAGDTDNIPEIQDIQCDIALIPVGGTYTMDYKQASELGNKINTKILIPIHYGSIVGTKEDAIKFKQLINTEKEVKILI